jgi:hypothetical protein
MSYREVSVMEIREILRLWLPGRGLREVAQLSGHRPQDDAPQLRDENGGSLGDTMGAHDRNLRNAGAKVAV